MTKEEYLALFWEQAVQQGKSQDYCRKWQAYAENLLDRHMPVIYSLDHFSKLAGYKPEYIMAACNAPEKFYHTFTIPKKSGGKRTISEPLPSLKEIQKWILDNVLVHMNYSVFGKAYIKGNTIKDNVRYHKGQKYVLKLDIKDFFGSISSYHVYQTFSGAGYNKEVAGILTGLCCLDKCLPQGAPSSAMLSNIVMKPVDDQIADFTKQNGIRYTRYADDMTFSGDFNSQDMIRKVNRAINQLNMKLNYNKTKIITQGGRQKVTGIVVNQKIQLPKEYRKKIRQQMYYINHFGLESHLSYIRETRSSYLQHLLGQVGYALFINPDDAEMREYKKELISLIKN